MGFYGNITSVNKSTFQFDKIYPNRAAMEDGAATDGIFTGRFVLVDYDQNVFADNLIDGTSLAGTPIVPAYMVVDWNDEVTFHTGASYTTPRLQFGSASTDEENAKKDAHIQKDGIIIILEKIKLSYVKLTHKIDFSDEEVTEIQSHESHVQLGNAQLWKCTGELTKITENNKTYSIAAFEKIYTSSEDSTNYANNAGIDAQRYSNFGRGWDSTVWQKTYKNGKSTYVMVAELNSVVPTFDISVDAPTETPIKPHYDTDSTNVYYKTHIQPSWGMRLKGASNEHYTTDAYIYPSDVNGSFIIDSTVKNNVTEKIGWKLNSDGVMEKYVTKVDLNNPVLDDEEKAAPLAVYFNKAGFDPYRGSDALADMNSQGVGIALDEVPQTEDAKKSPAARYDESSKKWILKDSIAMRPSGKSLNTYNYHYNGNLYFDKSLPDTYELSVMLPSIGQAISNIYDDVYGVSRIKDANGRTLWHKETGAFATEDFKTIEGEDGKVTKIRNGYNGAVRNANLAWDTNNGLRLVTDKLISGNNGIQGYEKSDMGTLAANINSAHDLMGMIIRNYEGVSLDKVDNWDPTRIYYIDGAYYKKQASYTYTENDSPTDSYNKIETMINLDNNTKYYRQEDNQLPILTGNLEEVSEAQYYDYRLSDEYVPGAIYGTIVEDEPVELSPTGYEKNKYYYKSKTSAIPTYTLDEADTPTNLNGVYYEIPDEKAATNPAAPIEGKEFYVPNRYLVYKKADKSISLAKTDTLEGLIGKTDSTLAVDDEGKSLYEFYRSATISQDGNTDAENVEYVRQHVLIDETGKDVASNWATINTMMSLPSNTNRYKYDSTSINDTLSLLAADEETVIQTISKDKLLYSDDKLVGYNTVRYKIKATSEKYMSVWDYTVANENNPNSYEWDLEDGEKILEYEYKYVEYTNNTTFSLKDKVKVDLIEFEYGSEDDPSSGYYFKGNDGSWVRENYNQLKNTKFGWERNTLTTNGSKSYIKYYKLTFTTVNAFYDLKNGYYYKNAKNEWCRETIEKTNSTDGVTYYPAPTFTPVADSVRFFEPNKYYLDAELTTLAETYDPDATYYEKTGKYVISDSKNIYHKGAEWNEEVAEIPSTVKLGIRAIKWEAKKLDGFARNLNTLHGLLLKTNDMLLADDSLTRENDTVQGCINSINDILAKFTTLTPGQIITVDHYGRIHSSELIDEQNGTWTNWGNGTTGIIDNGENWVTVHLDDDVDKPIITVQHEFKNARSTTTTVSDKNNDSTVTGTGNNKTHGDKLTLVEPIVDNMGHVIGKNIETVTLPFGFKTITPIATSDAVSDGTQNTTEVVADNTQDTLTIAPSNKWIRVAGDAEADKISVGHEVHDIDITDSTATDLNTNSIDSINIPDFTFDEAGHFTAKKKHNYTLPYNFRTIAVSAQSEDNSGIKSNTTSVVADSVYDTLTLGTGNEWINLAGDAANDKITFAHKVSLGVETAKGDTEAQTPSFGSTFKVPYLIADEAGHITALTDHTVKIPQPSLTNGTGNVVTGLTLTPSTGALIETKANVGSLTLTDYSLPESVTALPIASDTVNTAIGKLSKLVGSATPVNTQIENRIKELNVDEISGDFITSIAETDGKISATTGTFSSSIEEEDNKVLTSVNINSTGVITGTKMALGSMASESADDYSTTNSIEETFLAKTDAENTYLTSGSEITASETIPIITSKTTSLTMEDLVAYIISLEARIAELEK